MVIRPVDVIGHGDAAAPPQLASFLHGDQQHGGDRQLAGKIWACWWVMLSSCKYPAKKFNTGFKLCWNIANIICNNYFHLEISGKTFVSITTFIYNSNTYLNQHLSVLLIVLDGVLFDPSGIPDNQLGGLLEMRIVKNQPLHSKATLAVQDDVYRTQGSHSL